MACLPRRGGLSWAFKRQAFLWGNDGGNGDHLMRISRLAACVAALPSARNLAKNAGAEVVYERLVTAFFEKSWR